MSVRFLIPSLGYLGYIPFAVSAYLALAGRVLLGQDPQFLFISYSAIILSFLGGVLWGRSLQLEDGSWGRSLLLVSNQAAIFAWIGLLLGEAFYVVTLALLMLGYAAILLIEQRCFNTVLHDVDRSYMTLRLSLTSLVLVAHLLMILLSL